MANTSAGDRAHDMSLIHCLLCLNRIAKDRQCFPDCRHVFCSSCLREDHHNQQLCTSSRVLAGPPAIKHSQLPIECPNCPDTVAKSGAHLVSNVPYSHDVVHLTSGVAVKQHRVNVERCGLCEPPSIFRRRRNGRKRCTSCAVFLCERCFSNHAPNHSVMRCSKTKYKLKCRAHSQTVTRYCGEGGCKKLVCDKCVDDPRSHRQHMTQSLNSVRTSQLQKKSEQLERISKLAEQARDQHKTLTALLKRRQQECIKVKESIRLYAEFLHKSIDKHRAKLINDVESFETDLSTLYENHVSYLNSSRHHLENLKFFEEELVQPKFEASILLHQSDLKQHITRLETSQRIKDRHDLVLKSFSKILEFVSECHFDGTDVHIGKLNDEKRDKVPIESSSGAESQMPFQKAKLLFSTELGKASSGLCFGPSKIFVAENSQIASYSKTDGARNDRVIKVNRFLPKQLVLGSELLFVTDAHAYSVRGFDCNGDLKFNSKAFFRAPSGVALTADEELLVVTDTLHHTVTLLTASKGRLVRTFGGQGSRLGKFKHPAFVTVDDRDRIIVSDSMNHRVCVMSTSGRLWFVIGVHGSGPGELDQPQGVCCDEFGNILVADSNNRRVCRFSHMGKYLDTVLEFNNTTFVPYGIALNEDGNLAVTDKCMGSVHCFNIYNYQR